MDVCSNLGHCKLNGDIYPTCIWKDDTEYNSSQISFFFPTKGPPTPPPLIAETTGKGNLHGFCKTFYHMISGSDIMPFIILFSNYLS